MAKTELTKDMAADVPAPKSNVPNYGSLQEQLAEANLLVDDIVLKNYLSKLTDLDIVPLPDSLKKVDDIRLFKINEMVYQTDEYSTYKFASVFNSVQNLNCGVFVVADSDGRKTDFYIGVRSLDGERTPKSLKDTLRNALCGQFPGVKTTGLLVGEAEEFLGKIQSKNIAAVSCVAQNKDEEFTDNKRFIQGLEKLALAMQGRRYTAVVLAKSMSAGQLAEIRSGYEMIYTQLSPFANMQVSYGTNKALSISNAFTSGSSRGTSHTTNTSTTKGTSYSKGTSVNESETMSESDNLGKKIGAIALGVAGVATAPLTGGASIAAAIAIGAGNMTLTMIPEKTKSKTRGTSESETWSENTSETSGESDSVNEGTNESTSDTRGLNVGTSDNMQLTIQNKSLINTLERIDLQLKRIEECESLGMWECAAYFLSDTQETAEMAAGTYKALMRGEKSGVETSAISLWGRNNKKDEKKLTALREYITNFIHPEFEYRSPSAAYPVTAATLVSGNELAIQMGLPRKSVCGFPVIEHADFGKEVVKYDKGGTNDGTIELGKIFNMGKETNTEVRLNCKSLTMHTFITGSTGSGKSNTVYEILNKLRETSNGNVHFLVVEPAKGEYKNVFGHMKDVTVYGTNPQKTKLLKINPFRFPSDVHVLEHLDRLVELFNVCWPMYAAMPAILKEAMEKAYEEAGWDLMNSKNRDGEFFPNFTDVLEQIKSIVSESEYSAEVKGNYIGSLCTRVRSLTNGLNGLIFCDDSLPDEDLFDKNVIVDLSRVGSTETKSLIMGLLVMKLSEFRSSENTKNNNSLSHITVLEEAHHLLKRTSTEQSSESSNLLGKSVETLANAIAEMRTYGEGFIIADQSPGLLDMSVIRNTNTKIILRLPEQSDRELVGFAASLDEEQIAELSKLERGVAAVYQNDWVEPVLVKINHREHKEELYSDSDPIASDINVKDIRKQIVYMLIKGVNGLESESEHLKFDIDKIEKNMGALGLASRNRKALKRQIAEWRDKQSLSIWNGKRNLELSRQIVDILNIRDSVERVGPTTDKFERAVLTEKLASIVKQSGIDASYNITATVSYYMMMDWCDKKSSDRRTVFYRYIEKSNG